MLEIAASSFLFFMFLGVPVAFSMGFAGILGVWLGSDLPLALIPQRLFSGVDSFTLMAIPFFMLAGELMEAGGISRRLLRLADAAVGHLRGGLGQVTIATSVGFACISGSSAATTAGVGSIMVPEMKRQNYPAGLAATIQATAGSLGPIIPPSMTMIIFASLTGLSIGKLFLAGIVPGLLIGLALMILTYFYGRRYGLAAGEWKGFGAIIKAAYEASFSIFMPVIIIGGVVFGVFTATEAGAVAAFYALIIGMFVHRDLKWRDLPQILMRSVAMTSMVMLMIASAAIFGWILAYEGLPMLVLSILTAMTDNPLVVLLLIIGFLTIVGMFVETISATIIFAPILMPVAASYGLDPIHFAVVVTITLVYAGVTPPVGGILLLASSIAQTSYLSVLRYILPFIGVMYLILLLVAYIPETATWMANMMK